MEDLNRQIDALDVPTSMVELDQSYVEDCPATCPGLVRWYTLGAPVEAVRPELMSRFESAGVSVNEASASPDVSSARSDRHIFFIVLDPKMISGNASAPPGADAEISVHTLSEDQ